MYKKNSIDNDVSKRHIAKIWLMIRLITFILIATFMQVSAASFAQKITLSKSNARLKSVLKELKNQSGYVFLFTESQLKIAKPVNLKVNNQDFQEVLNAVFENQPLTYTINEKTITIKEKERSIIERAIDYFLNIDVKGKVVDEKGQPLVGASVSIKGTNRLIITNEKGEFSFTGVDEKAVLVISFIGYEAKEIGVKKELGDIKLAQSTGELEEVIVNTGYQTLPKERATGSFVHLDSELLNRRVGADILSRLEDITSGLVFNKDNFNAGNRSEISIRGQSTIFSNASPLVVLDNFPFEGRLTDINPNDVESITVLRDAAAASQWGARSGNGVIVITTKKGNYGSKQPKISFNTNATLSQKPNVYYKSVLTSADYIDIEQALFAKGAYSAAETSINKVALTPVVELLIKKRDQPHLSAEIDAQVADMKKIDVREDYQRYYYRMGQEKQYALVVSGGGEFQKYNFSTGYDKGLSGMVGNSNERLTLNAANTFTFFNSKLELSTNVNVTRSTEKNNHPGIINMTSAITNGIGYLYPYARFADQEGNPIGLYTTYRENFVTLAKEKGLLDWSYSPLDELENADESRLNIYYRVNFGGKYRISSVLRSEVMYQYMLGEEKGLSLKGLGTFAARSQINQFTAVNPNGSLTRPIPIGGIRDLNTSSIAAHQFRAQLAYNQQWNSHGIDAIGGFEVQDKKSDVQISRLYGYNDDLATGQAVSYLTSYTSYINGGQLPIPYLDSRRELTDRFLSYYFNGAYNYRKRYIFSASARLDQSNLFGVSANQRGVPLFSIGAAWNLAQEAFYNSTWLPELKLRATFGYNGNINRSVTAYTTAARAGTTTETRLPYNRIVNPPNPGLKWERIKVFNLALDFSLQKNILSGSIEFFNKNGIDLIGTTPFAASTGIVTFTGNTASTISRGFDLQLESHNLEGVVKWQSNFLMSYIDEKVVSYKTRATALAYARNTIGVMVPLEGRPLYAIYSYAWAGLDGSNGDPMGYLNGQPSKDYARVINNTSPDELVYHGSARPTYFGALRNTFSWKGFSLSLNMSFRLKYFVRRNSVRYSTDQGLVTGHGDYPLRWQYPGDELSTQIPSIPLAGNTNRDNLYTYSSVLVDRGDNVRLQDANFAYVFDKARFPQLPFARLQIYCYANNIGVVWKKSQSKLDPDYYNSQFPPSRTIALGLKGNF